MKSTKSMKTTNQWIQRNQRKQWIQRNQWNNEINESMKSRKVTKSMKKKREQTFAKEVGHVFRVLRRIANSTVKLMETESETSHPIDARLRFRLVMKFIRGKREQKFTRKIFLRSSDAHQRREIPFLLYRWTFRFSFTKINLNKFQKNEMIKKRFEKNKKNLRLEAAIALSEVLFSFSNFSTSHSSSSFEPDWNWILRPLLSLVSGRSSASFKKKK